MLYRATRGCSAYTVTVGPLGEPEATSGTSVRGPARRRQRQKGAYFRLETNFFAEFELLVC